MPPELILPDVPTGNQIVFHLSGLADGLPVGFQLIGPAFAENRLLAAAHALEGALAFTAVPGAVGAGA